MDDQFHNLNVKCCEESAVIKHAVADGLVKGKQEMIHSYGKEDLFRASHHL